MRHPAILALGTLLVAACGGADPIVMPCTLPLTIVLTPASYTITVNDAATFRVGMLEGCGAQPHPASVTWSTTNAAVAAIPAFTDSTITLRAIGPGQTTVIATSREDAAVKAAGLITVVRIPGHDGGI